MVLTWLRSSFFFSPLDLPLSNECSLWMVSHVWLFTTLKPTFYTIARPWIMGNHLRMLELLPSNIHCTRVLRLFFSHPKRSFSPCFLNLSEIGEFRTSQPHPQLFNFYGIGLFSASCLATFPTGLYCTSPLVSQELGPQCLVVPVCEDSWPT